MPITPPAASLPDIRPDFAELHHESEYTSHYGYTTKYHSPETGQQVVYHIFKYGVTPRCEGGYGLGNVLSAQPGAHVVLNVEQCEAPEPGFLEDLEANCGPDITYTLVTAEQWRADRWLYDEAARLRIFEALLPDPDLKHVLYSEQIGPWDAHEQGVALANIIEALSGSGRSLDERFDGRLAEGYREVWACPDHATGDRMRSLRSVAQLVQWALEGIIDGGVVGTDESEAVHGQIKRIKHAVDQLLEELNPDEED